MGTVLAGAAGNADVPVAERLYYDSPGLEFAAKVTDIRLVATEKGESGAKSHLWQVALDRTAFYPESGGQPWDTGVLVATARSGTTLEVPVERVVEDEAAEVWHTVRKPLEAGTAVTGRVDAFRRTDHTQQHSGQHLLSAVFLERLGARTVAFHLGAESVTIDLALPQSIAALSPEQMDGVEDEANRLIFEDRPLTPRWHTRAEAEAMLARGQLRKLPKRQGPMRVVEMGGVEFNACGGTHVASTGAIGGLLLRGTEKIKEGVRVEFVCGLRAVRAARREHALLAGVAGALSVGAGDVPARVAALQRETKALGKERQSLLREVAVAEANWLHSTVSTGALIEAPYKKKSVEFALALAAELRAKGRGAVIDFEQGEDGGVVFLRRPGSLLDAGQVVKALFREGYGMRGGGSAELAHVLTHNREAAHLLREQLARIAKEEQFTEEGSRR